MKVKIKIANPEYEYKITAEVISWFGFCHTTYTLEGDEWQNAKTSDFLEIGSKTDKAIGNAFSEFLDKVYSENRSKEFGKTFFPTKLLTPEDIGISTANLKQHDDQKVKLDKFSSAFCPLFELSPTEVNYDVSIVKDEENITSVFIIHNVAPITSKYVEPAIVAISINAANKTIESLMAFAANIANWHIHFSENMFGPTALLINPVFHHVVLPIGLIRDNRVNVDMFDEIFGTIEEVISKVRSNPQYLAQCAEHGLKSKIVVGADPLLALMLANRGIDAVTTDNIRMRNKIIVVPTIEETEETKDKPHYLRFGNFVTREVSVTDYVGENPNLAGYKVYQPTYRVVLNVPIMGIIEFS